MTGGRVHPQLTIITFQLLKDAVIAQTHIQSICNEKMCRLLPR
jgi:hypothetical protein